MELLHQKETLESTSHKNDDLLRLAAVYYLFLSSTKLK